MSDYFDFSIYIDADVKNIKTWYLERFQTLLELARKDETTITIVYQTYKRRSSFLSAKNLERNQLGKSRKLYRTHTKSCRAYSS